MCIRLIAHTDGHSSSFEQAGRNGTSKPAPDFAANGPPVAVTIQIAEDLKHHIVAAMLRPGKASEAQGAIAMLKRPLERLRKTFAHAEFLLRSDGAFLTPEALDRAEDEGLEYLIPVPINSALRNLAEPWMKKAEVTVCEGGSHKDNQRYVVPHRRSSPKHEDRVCAKRGETENGIQALLQGLRFDLAICTKFLANPSRELLTMIDVRVFEHGRRIFLEAPRSSPSRPPSVMLR